MHFEGLKLDPYLRGNTYRHRAVSRFAIEENGQIERLPNAPLYQASTYNPIKGFGGIERSYDDIPSELMDETSFKHIIKEFIELLPDNQKTFSCHMIRTTLPGMPAPEGVHRDGVSYQAISVISRNNVKEDSGLTSLLDNDKELLFESVLEEGDMLFFDDRITYHDTSEVIKKEKDKLGYRDVFILSSPDHAHFLPAE